MDNLISNKIYCLICGNKGQKIDSSIGLKCKTPGNHNYFYYFYTNKYHVIFPYIDFAEDFLNKNNIFKDKQSSCLMIISDHLEFEKRLPIFKELCDLLKSYSILE